MQENKDYEIIPNEDDANVWNVRILTGYYTEMVFHYKAVGFDEKSDAITFNYTINSFTDDTVTESDQELLEVVGNILEDIIDNSANT